MIRKLESLNEASGKRETLKKIVDLHGSILEQTNHLNEALSWTVFALEMVCYACFLLAWIVKFYSQSSFIFFVYMFSLANQYFTICLGNEKLQQELQNLVETIYDIPWYEMKPGDRKYLVFILKVAQKPLEINAGPFHKANFVTFLNTARRWYSFVLLLNSSVTSVFYD